MSLCTKKKFIDFLGVPAIPQRNYIINTYCA